jgi:hypothetical protein
MRKIILSLYLITLCSVFGNAQTAWNSSTYYNVDDKVSIPITTIISGISTTNTYTFVCKTANQNQNPNVPANDYLWAIDKMANALPLLRDYRYVTIGNLATYNGTTFILSNTADMWPPQISNSGLGYGWTVYVAPPKPLSGWGQWDSSPKYIFSDKVWENINGTIYYFTNIDNNTTLSANHDPATSPDYWAVSDIMVLPYLSTLHYKINGMKATYGGSTYTLTSSDAPAQSSSNQPPVSTLWSTSILTPTSCYSSLNCTSVMGDDGSTYIKSYQTPTNPVIVNQKNVTYYYNQVPGFSTMVNLGEIRNPISPLALNDNDILLRGSTDINHGLGYYGSAGNMGISTPKKRNFADTPVDGPVLYGWAGGALGLRQRSDLSIQTSWTAEKIALRWDWASVNIGSTSLPMNFIVNGTGKIGIETTSPNATLQIGSDDIGVQTLHCCGAVGTPANANGVIITANTKNVPTSDRALLELHSPGNVNQFIIQSLSDRSYIGNLDKTKPLILQAQGGPIGIGTIDTHGYTLAVNGSMIATSIEVLAFGSWPDFVFGKDYKLRSLKETEEYINKNSHLPEVPSEAEVSKKGINVAEMNATLLKKVEELTLYMIDMQKQLDATNTELARLKKQKQ